MIIIANLGEPHDIETVDGTPLLATRTGAWIAPSLIATINGDAETSKAALGDALYDALAVARVHPDHMAAIETAIAAGSAP